MKSKSLMFQDGSDFLKILLHTDAAPRFCHSFALVHLRIYALTHTHRWWVLGWLSGPQLCEHGIWSETNAQGSLFYRVSNIGWSSRRSTLRHVKNMWRSLGSYSQLSDGSAGIQTI